LLVPFLAAMERKDTGRRETFIFPRVAPLVDDVNAFASIKELMKNRIWCDDKPYIMVSSLSVNIFDWNNNTNVTPFKFLFPHSL